MTERANAATTALKRALLATVAPTDRLVLAVSGGRDSMVLLDGMARWRRGAIVAVATFDHGTGDAARSAAELVRVAARLLELPVAHGRGSGLAGSEAAWRAARWDFLRETADVLGARVATAHTWDDQVETVFIRALRSAGARGLAGLFADSDIVRPLLELSRSMVAEYAAARRLPVADDPTNLSRRYLRNRVRLDLLPAFERVRPGFGAELVAVSRRAADWRAGVERHVDALAPWCEGGRVHVDAPALLAHDAAARAILWPALAARAGIALDRRGTERLAAFTTRSARMNRVQLAGGHEVVRHARSFEIRPAATLAHGAPA